MTGSMLDVAPTTPPNRSTTIPPLARLWRRQLDAYPPNRARAFYLAIVVLTTIVLYYELYIQGAVATQIIHDFDMSLRNFIVVSIVGNAVGALASIFAGLADRWGRANLVVGGLLITGVLIIALASTTSTITYTVLFALISLVEGVVLVATPALIRDFSPQLGRAVAMGFWTLGPVLGSLVVTEVSSNTLPTHPDWQFQLRLCGVIGLVVFLVALVGLRELAPRLRDQLMVSMRDRVLIEAKAAGIDPGTALQGSWRQMLRFDVVGPALAISLFLLFYYFAVGFFVIYFSITFGYDEARANALANWYWISNAIALVVVGVLSDRLRVRKPFMIVGALISAAGVAVFALLTTHPDTGYYTFAWLMVVIAGGGGIAYCAWMAAFTETVERHNPAATATGLAIWGAIIRAVVTVSLIVLMFAVNSASVLVDHGTRVSDLAGKYEAELATAELLSPTTSDALSTNPDDQTTQAVALSEIGDIPLAEVAVVATASEKYAQELATLQAIDPATATTLATNPTDQAAGATAVAEIAQKFGIGVPAATERLIAAAQVPKSDLAAIQQYGPQVQQAVAKLTALSKVPKDDLAYLQEHGADVVRAQDESPRQWQRWWWVAFAGQLIFLPFVFVMVGRWSPRAAKRDARLHEEAVEQELRALRGSDQA